jgi:hypothetical protein
MIFFDAIINALGKGNFNYFHQEKYYVYTDTSCICSSVSLIDWLAFMSVHIQIYTVY